MTKKIKHVHHKKKDWPIRRVFFYLLVLLFLILLPTILLYSLGYRWDMASRTLTRAGLIAIKTVPEGAEITLNGKKLRSKSPATLSLIPGSYDIDLELKGYLPYSKKVEVSADRVTRLEKTVFFSKAPKFHSFQIPETMEGFFLGPSKKRALVIAKDKEYFRFFICHMGDKTFRELASLPRSAGLDLNRVDVSWSLDETAMLVHGQDFYYVVFLRRPQESYLLKEVLGYNPEVAKFSRRIPLQLYFLHGGKLHLWDIRKKEVRAEYMEDVADFEPVRFGFYWLKKGGSDIYRSNSEGVLARKVATLRDVPGKVPLVWGSSGKAFFFLEEARWAVLDGQGNFNVFDPVYFQSGVKGFRFSSTGDKILVWNDYELWFLELNKNENASGGAERFNRKLLFESELPIQAAFWSPDDNYAFFLTHRKLYAIEIDTEGGVNLYPYYVSSALIPPRTWAADEEEGLFYWITSLKEARQLRVLRMTVGFFEPLVNQITEMRDRVDDLKDKIQSHTLFTPEKKESD